MRAQGLFNANGSLSKDPERSMRSWAKSKIRRNTSRATVVNFTSPRIARLIFLRTAISGTIGSRQTLRARREYVPKCVHPKAEAGGLLTWQSRSVLQLQRK